jgi:hypothetical protein
MKNFEAIIEKLTKNRTTLLMNRFDKELKEILEQDIHSFKDVKTSKASNNSTAANGRRLVA